MSMIASTIISTVRLPRPQTAPSSRRVLLSMLRIKRHIFQIMPPLRRITLNIPPLVQNMRLSMPLRMPPAMPGT